MVCCEFSSVDVPVQVHEYALNVIVSRRWAVLNMMGPFLVIDYITVPNI